MISRLLIYLSRLYSLNDRGYSKQSYPASVLKPDPSDDIYTDSDSDTEFTDIAPSAPTKRSPKKGMSPFFVLGKIYKINTKYAARNVLKGYESQPKANNLRHFAIQRARAPLFVFHFAKLSRFWRPLAVQAP